MCEKFSAFDEQWKTNIFISNLNDVDKGGPIQGICRRTMSATDIRNIGKYRELGKLQIFSGHHLKDTEV